MAEQWFYTSQGRQMDPVSTAELKQLAGGGHLKPTDLIWKEGLPKWIRAGTVKGLFAESGVKAEAPAVVKTARAEPETNDWKESKSSPRRRKSRGDEDDDDDYEERPRRKRRQHQGMSPGAKVGLIASGMVVLLVVAGLTVFLILRSSADANAKGDNNQVAKGGNPAPKADNNPVKQPDPVKPQDPVIPAADTVIDAVAMVREYQTNRALADKKYSNRVITVQGRVRDKKGTTIALETNLPSIWNQAPPGATDVVQARLRNLGDAIRVRVGEIVQVKGFCTGFNQIFDVEMNNCELIRPGKR